MDKRQEPKQIMPYWENRIHFWRCRVKVAQRSPMIRARAPSLPVTDERAKFVTRPPTSGTITAHRHPFKLLLCTQTADSSWKLYAVLYSLLLDYPISCHTYASIRLFICLLWILLDLSKPAVNQQIGESKARTICHHVKIPYSKSTL